VNKPISAFESAHCGESLVHLLFSDDQRVVLTVVVPTYNEMAVLDICYQRLHGVMEGIGLPYELLYVDDGSRDGSGETLMSLASQDSHVRVVRLSRNFGKEAAITAGLDHAQGEGVILIDADLQDPPELIPDMVAAWRNTGADVIAMRRRSRSGESWFKRSCAHVFYRTLSRLSEFPIPEDTGDFRLLSRRAVDSINRLPERSRYMKGLFAWVGFPTHEIVYDRAPRAAGHSKWGFFGLFRLALEGVTSFSAAPLRWVTGLGLLTAAVGAAFGLWIVVKTLQGQPAPSGYPSSVAVMTFLGGIQLLSIGLLGEYIGRIYVESKQRPRYLVRDISEAVRKPASCRETSRERLNAGV
jgi:glycosyltransferase involved in cell wall biosynthesis